MPRLYNEIRNRKADAGIFDGIVFVNGTVKNPQRPPKVSKSAIRNRNLWGWSALITK